MKKRLQILVPLILLCSMILLPMQSFAASSLQQIEQQLQNLEKQRENAAWQQKITDSKLHEVKHNKAQAQQEFNNLLDVEDQVSADMQKYQTQIGQTKTELLQTGKDLDSAEKRVSERNQLLKDKIRLMYTNGTVKYVDVLLNATSFADFLDRFNLLTSIVSEDKSILEANQRDRDLIAVKKQKVETDLANLNGLYAKLDDKRQQLLVKEKEKEVLIASLQKDQQDLEEISSQQEQQLIAIAAQQSNLNAEKKKLQFKPSGKLSYPLPQWYPVTSGFGYRVDPITGKRGAFHNGYDLGAPGGTDILAAADGVVIVAQWYGGFGNCVIIDHGNGLWTLYGHMSKIIANKDEVVKRGQVIGEVGSTGRATGNHLHFTVYLNEKAVDPSGYVNFN